MIAGAGLAGLALAVELTGDAFRQISVVLIDPRTVYHRDRTWSYWRVKPHRYQGLETASWNRWRLSGEGLPLDCGGDTPYCTIRGDDFYAHALALINASPNIRHLQGVSVESIEASGSANVALSDGSVLSAKLVFDARPPEKAHQALYFQSFSGTEFQADRDCFDSRTVDLMDFQATDECVHFFYVLPFTTRRALVESTRISLSAGNTDDGTCLLNYCSRRWPQARLQPVFHESGCLPLTTSLANSQQHTSKSVVPLGTRAGTCRAATGYAFLETVLDAQRIAESIRDNQFKLDRVQRFVRPASDRWMDDVFLSALLRQPEHAERFFRALFKRCPSEVLLRFLSGQHTPIDRVRVAMSLPVLPFLRSALVRLT